MRIVLIIIFISIPITVFGQNKIIGTWVPTDYNYDQKCWIYSKQKKFSSEAPGIQFMNGGNLRKRQNVGWCGTPPVTYGNYNGTWKLTSDSTITIRYKYWGGVAEDDLIIVELTEDILRLKNVGNRVISEK